MDFLDLVLVVVEQPQETVEVLHLEHQTSLRPHLGVAGEAEWMELKRKIQTTKHFTSTSDDHDLKRTASLLLLFPRNLNFTFYAEKKFLSLIHE